MLVAACVLAAAAWVYLVAAHGGFWRTDVRLPGGADPQDPDRWPSVAAVVPARDEAAILPETVPTLLAQDYPGTFSVVLVDDGSSDGTGAAAAALAGQAPAGQAPAGQALAGQAPAGPVLRVVAGRPLPPGWAG